MSDFHAPRNTSRAMREDPAEALLFLAESMGVGGSDTAIVRQEAAGQRQLVNSSVIPSDARGQESELEALGFVLGDQVDGDPMFRQATLPAGWKRDGSDHAMWSYIVDDLCRRRCSIFYKAAFYDRSAHMSVTSVAGYVSECIYDGKAPVLDDAWATKEAVLAAIDAMRARDLEQASFWTGHGNEEYAAEHRVKVQRCDGLKARIEAGS